MHSIAMAVPQLFSADSTSAEKTLVKAALKKCDATLQSLDSRSRLRRGGTDQVVFLLPHVFHVGSDLTDNSAALEPLLECLCDIDLAYRQTHPSAAFLYDSPVYYERTVVWDSTPALYARGYGDCKSLACALVSEYRAAGLYARPTFRFLPPNGAGNSSGQFQYHILVAATCLKCMGAGCAKCEGKGWGWEDPSKVKGMGKNEHSYFKT
jgi:hypothetical protein